MGPRARPAFRPLPWELNLRLAIGSICLGASILLGGSVLLAMHRARTPAEPWKPAARIVTGPFRETRNPIYMALVLAFAGIAGSRRRKGFAIVVYP